MKATVYDSNAASGAWPSLVVRDPKSVIQLELTDAPLDTQIRDAIDHLLFWSSEQASPIIYADREFLDALEGQLHLIDDASITLANGVEMIVNGVPVYHSEAALEAVRGKRLPKEPAPLLARRSLVA